MDERWIEELSARLDNEANGGEPLEALLAQNPGAKERYAQLAKLSQELQALQAPAENPAFVAQVMARIEETAHPRRIVRLSFKYASLAAAAMLLVVAGLVFSQPSSQPTQLATPSEALHPATHPVLTMRQLNEVQLQEQLAAVVGDDTESMFADSSDPAIIGDATSISTTEGNLLPQLVQLAWSTGLDFDEEYSTEENVDYMLDMLSASEVESVRNQLSAYESGVWVDDEGISQT